LGQQLSKNKIKQNASQANLFVLKNSSEILHSAKALSRHTRRIKRGPYVTLAPSGAPTTRNPCDSGVVWMNQGLELW